LHDPLRPYLEQTSHLRQPAFKSNGRVMPIGINCISYLSLPRLSGGAFADENLRGARFITPWPRHPSVN